MTVVGLHDFVKVSISAEFKSCLLLICIDAPESTTNSRSSGLRFDAGTHLVSEGEKNVALFFSFTFRTLLASIHAASRAHRSCHSVSCWDRSSNFGALGLRWWGSPGQMYPSEGFWSRMCAWRATAFVHFTRRIGFRMSELLVKSMKTSAAPYPGIRTPFVVYLMSCTQRVSPFYRMTHASSTWPLHFCHHSF